VGCYIWYSEEGTGWAAAPPSPLLAVPNVTAHLSTASVSITVLLYDCPLLCGFNAAIKGLIIELVFLMQRIGSTHRVAHGTAWLQISVDVCVNFAWDG